jgi:NAD dependent epimerase/dehydratase
MMEWTDKSVLVTGAGGFIGSHLAERLLEMDAEVTAFVHYNSRNDWGMLADISEENKSRIKVVTGDITDTFAVKKAVQNQDIVFHLAALIGIPYSYSAPQSYVNTNVMGTLNVMQACLDAGVSRIIHTSTSEVYGTARYVPIDEEHPLQGQSPYSASKIAADKIAESFYCSFNLPVSTIRPFNTFGPRQSMRAVIPTIIIQALTSNEIKLGSLDPLRDLTFVPDTVNGFIKMAESKKAIGRVINVGSGECTSIGALAQRILLKVNPQAKISTEKERVRPDKSEVMRLECNNTRAKTILHWKPQYSLDEGLDQTIAWMKTHVKDYKSTTYTV